MPANRPVAASWGLGERRALGVVEPWVPQAWKAVACPLARLPLYHRKNRPSPVPRPGASTPLF